MMDRREAIKIGAVAVAAVTAPGAVVEAFDKEGGVPTIGGSDLLILECKKALSPAARDRLYDTWEALHARNSGLPRILLLDDSLTLAGIIKGEERGE